MIHDKHITVVLPAFNAERTLAATVRDLPGEVDDVLLVDDGSDDGTVDLARRLGLRLLVHASNRGYGANQKTCYSNALATGADVVVMVHPDYQYSPRLVSSLAALVACGEYDLALGSRMLLGGALRGGMPLYKFLANHALTTFQNLLLGASLSEYHTGFRAYSRGLLQSLPFDTYSDDFVFDNQLLTEAVTMGARIGEISCPTRYFAEASSINLRRSVTYGLGVVKTSLQYRMARRRTAPASALAEGDR